MRMLTISTLVWLSVVGIQNEKGNRCSSIRETVISTAFYVGLRILLIKKLRNRFARIVT